MDQAGWYVSLSAVVFFTYPSAKNTEEVLTVINLIKNYYHDKEVVIITPYDSQRAALVRALKAAGLLAWQNVYTVDSFQGQMRSFAVSLQY